MTAPDARKRNSKRARAIVLAKYSYVERGRYFMKCHICKMAIDVEISTWEAEHIVPFALGGKDDPENLAPVHWGCHKPKTGGDITMIAKGKRVQAKRFGVKRSKRPMMGSKRSGWKKKMSGAVERR